MNFKEMCPIVLFSFVFIAAGSASMMMTGGRSETRRATEEVQTLINGVREDLENRMNGHFTTFIAVSFKTQVVAGTNYFVKVDVGDGDIIYLRIFVALPHTGSSPPSLRSFRRGSATDTDIPYF